MICIKLAFRGDKEICQDFKRKEFVEFNSVVVTTILGKTNHHKKGILEKLCEKNSVQKFEM